MSFLVLGALTSYLLLRGRHPLLCCSLTVQQQRKGWDVLLRAFVNEFSAAGNVALIIKASSFVAGGLNLKAIVVDAVMEFALICKQAPVGHCQGAHQGRVEFDQGGWLRV